MQQKRQKKLSRSPQRNPQTTNTTRMSNKTHSSPYKFSKKRGTSVTIPSDSYRIGKREQVEKCKVSKIQKLTNNEKSNFVKKELKLKLIQRRQQIGLDFLNKIPKKSIQLLLQRQKNEGLSQIKQNIPKKLQSSQNYRVPIMEKNQLLQQNKQNEKVKRNKDTKKQLSICRNILKQSKSTQRCKKRSRSSITQKNQPTQRNSSSKTKNEITTQLTGYEGELLEKYKQLQARYQKIYSVQYDESSCVQYLTDTDPNLLPSQPTSNKYQQQAQIEEFILDKDEINYLKEFSILEIEYNRMHSAATKIQKCWRGFITRKMILDQQFEQYYYEQPEILNEETFRSQFRFEKDSQSIQQGKEQQTIHQPTYQTDLNIFQDLESEKIVKQKDSINISDKFVKYQKMKWQELLNYISKLESQVQQKSMVEVLNELKLFTQQCSKDCSLSRFQIKKLEILVPQFSQESMVMSEIRQAMCSKKLIKQIIKSQKKQENESIFEEQPFNEFGQKRIDEIMNRSQMDELIKMKQQMLKEQQKQQQQVLTQQFEQKLISPKTFKEKYYTLEKWVNKQYEDIENNKINFEKGWLGLYNTFIQTEKELKFLQQQKYSQNSQLSNSQQYINYSISAFSDSGYKKSLHELSNHHETLIINNYIQEFENNHLKTHSSTSQTPNEKIKYQNLDINHETIEWEDEQLLISQQFLNNNQNTEKNIVLEQAEIDYLHQEIQNEELTWLNYDEFKFYVLMDISNLVFKELIQEFEQDCIQTKL